MAGSTGGIVYFRPTIRGPQGTGAVVYFSHRQVAGIYSTVNLSGSTVKKDWRPHAGVPVGYVNGDRSKPVTISEEWLRHFRFLGNAKLGGSNFPTLPDVANFVTQQQIDAQLAAAQDQWQAANAQTLQALLEVVKSAGLTGADQVPSAVLARQETNPQPIVNPIFGETGGGGGGD